MLTIINAQDLISSNYTFVKQQVAISNYQNKPFRLSAAIRKLPNNNNEVVNLYAKLRNETGKGAYITDIGSRPLDTNWHVYTLEGVVEADSKMIIFGLACYNNGTFFFDDFKLEVEIQKGEWKPIAIKNPDFETPLKKPPHVWNSKYTSTVKQFTSTITNKNPFSGNYCLEIQGKGVYGQNDAKGGFIEANGISFYHEIYGEGEPLLLLHGAGQSLGAFAEQIDFFSKHYKVIAVDSRGRGRSSDKENEPFTYVEQAKDMSLFLETLNIEKAHIIGWSDGGIIGLIMAMYYPEKVNKLVAMAANINPEGIVTKHHEKTKERLKVMALKNDPEDKIDIKIYRALVNYPQLEYKDLNVITAPTLVMAGDHDLIKHIHTVKIYDAITNAHLAILPGESHWLPEANATLFNSTVFTFLNEPFKAVRRF
jgi:pimeloyl-ACP methyl ester carboxylesterase